MSYKLKQIFKILIFNILFIKIKAIEQKIPFLPPKNLPLNVYNAINPDDANKTELKYACVYEVIRQ